jgi:hypothetical protein
MNAFIKRLLAVSDPAQMKVSVYLLLSVFMLIDFVQNHAYLHFVELCHSFRFASIPFSIF